MISIGAVFGPELQDSAIRRAIMRAMNAAADLRGDFEFGSKPAINVVFHVPGKMDRLDWDGLRDATFFRKKQLLMVQVAAPKEVVESTTPEEFVIESLYGANAVAFEFFRQKGMQFPLAEAEELVGRIAQRVRETT